MKRIPGTQMEESLTGTRLPPEEWLLANCVARISGAAATRYAPAHPVTSRHWEKALPLASRHRILPLLHYLCRRDGSLPEPPRSVLDRLERSYWMAAVRHLLHAAHLQRILPALEEHGIPVIVLKGNALAESIYPEPAMRAARDIDLMVHSSQLSRAADLLESVGFVPVDDPDVQESYRRHHHHLAPYVHRPSASWVDLHWHIVRPGGPYRLDVAGLWERSRRASMGGAQFLVLGLEDQLLHLCLHFLNDRRGDRVGALLQVCDIALLLEQRGHEIDWDGFVDRTLRTSLGDAVFTSLYCVLAVTGAFCPATVMSRLRPQEFDEGRASLFISRRVIGAGRESPRGVVQALAQPKIRGKAQGVLQAMLPAARWVPTGDEGQTRRSGEFSKVILRPWAMILALGKIFPHLPRLWDQVLVEQWLSEGQTVDSPSVQEIRVGAGRHELI